MILDWSWPTDAEDVKVFGELRFGPLMTFLRRNEGQGKKRWKDWKDDGFDRKERFDEDRMEMFTNFWRDRDVPTRTTR